MKTHSRHLALPVMTGLLLAGSLALRHPTAAATSTSHATTSTQSAKMVLPWIEDDYTRAVADAKARRVPIFVESWAPW